MTIVKPKPLDDGFQTPWEKKGEEYDPEKGRAFIHYLSTQAYEQQEVAAKVTGERDAFKAKVESAERANETELERITRENTELKEKAAKADAPDLEKLRLQVALDKGLTALQAKRLVGNTLEEITADADELVKVWNPKADDGEDEGNNSPESQPKSSLRNPGDPNPQEGRFDPDKAADEYMSRNLSL